MKQAINKNHLVIDPQDFTKCPTIETQPTNDLLSEISLNHQFVLKDQTAIPQSQNFQSISFQRYTQTPDFSRRVDINKITESDVDKQSSLLRKIREQFQCLKKNPFIQDEIKSVDQLLKQIENKLGDRSCLNLTLGDLCQQQFSPIKNAINSQRSSQAGGILYTYINISDLVSDENDQIGTKRRQSSILGLDNILYLLGENCNMTGIHSRKSSDVGSQTCKINELNAEIQMLDNVLRMKNEKSSNFSSKRDQSLKSTKRLRQSRKNCDIEKTRLSPLQRIRNSLASRSKQRTLNQSKLQSTRKILPKNPWALQRF